MAPGPGWWVWVDSNHRPHPYQGCALTELSYRPVSGGRGQPAHPAIPSGRQIKACVDVRQVVFLLFKEVIQPQIPLRLPCYDFTPVIDHTVVIALPKVRQTTSGAANFHGVTGGVYKARERIHRDIADSRLLAIPTSRSRVADSDPD